MVSVEVADFVFASDSIPAVFGVTRNTFVIFASNAFALLGMRALYVVFAKALGRFTYLRHGLVVLLGFIGLKMLAGHWVQLPHLVTLAVIVGVLGISVLASRRGPQSLAAAGEPDREAEQTRLVLVQR
jgi:tellurite resistance protein TerC